jgi:multidrug transporter EmrE-like cation transporter
MAYLWAVGLVILATLIGAFGGLILKKSSNKLKLSFRGLFKNYLLIVGLLFYMLSSIFFIISLKGGELNVLYPITSASYIWIVILSKKYLGEEITLYKVVGISLIILGIIAITI